MSQCYTVEVQTNLTSALSVALCWTYSLLSTAQNKFSPVMQYKWKCFRLQVRQHFLCGVCCPVHECIFSRHSVFPSQSKNVLVTTPTAIRCERESQWLSVVFGLPSSDLGVAAAEYKAAAVGFGGCCRWAWGCHRWTWELLWQRTGATTIRPESCYCQAKEWRESCQRNVDKEE